MANPSPSSHKPKAYKHAPLAVVHVKWVQTPDPFIIRIRPKPHLIGVVHTKSKRWIVNNLLTREYAEGIAKTYDRAQALVVSHLAEMGKNSG